jgi:hypothetical protein
MMMFGDGFCNQTKEPPVEIPAEFAENFYSYENGLWVAVSHTMRKRLDPREDEFVRDVARLFCQYLRPVQAYRFPFN